MSSSSSPRPMLSRADAEAYRRIDYDEAAHPVHRLEVEGREREYLVHLPHGLRPEEGPRPIWIALHGGGTSAARMVEFSGLSDLADRERFVAVYPEGTGWLKQALTFNAGQCCGYAQQHGVDDVAFVARVIDAVAETYAVDRSRVYVLGFSNGGMMAHRIGNVLADRVTAVASVSGQPCVDLVTPCRVVPTLHFHGTSDEFAPYEGGIGRRSMSKTDHRSVVETLADVAVRLGCEATAVKESPQDAGGNLLSVRTVWHAGGEERVVLYTIEGGGHTWPGRSSRFPILGPVAMKLDAHAILTEFFARHRLPG